MQIQGYFITLHIIKYKNNYLSICGYKFIIIFVLNLYENATIKY